MDYCLPCQRHLNGALACAGCGTPVEELRRHYTSAPAADNVLELDEVSEPAGHRRARRPAPPRRKPAGTRRARKPRGRKVMLGTFGLVLAAGALSLAELALENPGDDGAATSVKDETPVETEEALEPTGPTETPQGPDPVTEPAVSTSSSVRPTGTGTGVGTGDGDGTGGSGAGSGSSGDGKPSATGPAEASPSPSSSAGDPSRSAPPPPSDAPPDGGAGDEPTQPPAEPAPDPTPTETCEPFLWWCI
ncbi:hypothetical protein OG883_23840 [Streptomyces sp. NBC_01142]|uniref:SCO2400 family protein n=1 Tax=Streptomyces sp. NBC_01142 TaxID=2975865 RepID=UPI00225630D3|nr:hypothetical protein [Streptomyces sp. NBC_01142]MCX4822873.1 hypothetical protein [Streptomyces sp. NBC_01142]